METKWFPITSALSKTTALDLAHAMLTEIGKGNSYSIMEFHDKVQAIGQAIRSGEKF